MVEASWPINGYPSPHPSSSLLDPQSSHISLWTRRADTWPSSSWKATITGFPQPVLPSETRWLFFYTRGTSPLTCIWARRPILYLRVWWHLSCSTSTPPSPHHTDPDPILASLQRLHLRMDGFDQRFDRIEAQQSRIDQFMVDYQRSQYPVYDHLYRQGYIAPDHVHLSWYTSPLGDFGYVYGSRGR